MTVPYTSDPDTLAEAVAVALEQDGKAQVTALPGPLAADPDLDEAWVFDWGDSLELLISAQHRARRADGPLARACAGEEQAGGFRLVARYPRDDDGLSDAIADLQSMASDRAAIALNDGSPPAGAIGERPSVPPADDPAPPRALTDLDQVLAPRSTQPPPTAEEIAASLSLGVKGQAGAIGVVADALASHLAKVDPRRPLRVLLLGPSGVGKNETFEAVARMLAAYGGDGRDWQTVRLAGNQLREAHNVADVLGTSAGYVGFEQGSSLVQALATSPRTLILIDEIDKAHPDISVALMGMMDEGRLVLRRPVNGRWTLDCREAVLVFTSNAAAAELNERTAEVEPSGLALESLARQILVAHGMPEWIAGRHGHIAVYRPLPRVALAEIATLEVDRCTAEFGLQLEWVEPEIIGQVLADADAGAIGARAVRAVVERVIGTACAAYLGQLGEHAHHDGDGPSPNRRVVIAGPDPHCEAYADWLAVSFDDDEPPASPEGGAPAPERP
jgi:hypothetical protein